MRQPHWAMAAGRGRLGLAVVCAACAPVWGGVGQPVSRITAWDAQAGDGFGWSVALSNQVVVVGAPANNGVPGPGAAYVYDKHTGAALHAFTPLDATVGDAFGSSVAVDGGKALVGAVFGGSDQSTLAGAAYLFDANLSDQLFKLSPQDSEAADRFGAAVAVGGVMGLIGAPGDNTAAGVDAGSAYLFDLTNGTQLLKLTASDASAAAGFGASVALDGTHAVIGAPGDTGPGAAYIFDAATGAQTRKLIASDADNIAGFGRSVAAANGWAVIGAPASDAQPAAGAAYVFDLATGDELLKLTASDSAVGDRFGSSVAIGQNKVIVGATLGTANDESLAGAAYVFDLITGQQLAKLTASDTQAIDYFGGSVALSGDTAAVGAYGLNTDAGVDAGAAYLFNLAMPITGDLDGDGFVGIGDLNIVLGNWNQSVTAGNPAAGDASGDGYVGLADLDIVLGHWNVGTPPVSGAASVVPEPVYPSVLVLIFAMSWRCRPRIIS